MHIIAKVSGLRVMSHEFSFQNMKMRPSFRLNILVTSLSNSKEKFYLAMTRPLTGFPMLDSKFVNGNPASDHQPGN